MGEKILFEVETMQKRIITAAMCIICILITSVVPCTVFGSGTITQFSDVPIHASYYTAVEELSSDNIINGRGDGTFAPGDNITRAEFCTILARTKNFNDATNIPETPFNDIKGHWAEKYIAFCYDKGYVNGMDEDTFAPNENVTCEQAIKMVVCASGIGDESLSGYGDVNWYTGYIVEARKNGLLTGMEKDTSKPASKQPKIADEVKLEIASPAKRAFGAQLLYNTLTVVDTASEDVVDLSGNSTNVNVAAVNLDEGDFWEPTQEEADKIVAEYYIQYYGEDDYEIYVEEDIKGSDYTIAETPVSEPEFVPTGSSEGMTIVLDPGHNYSGVDTGAVGNGLREQDITYYIAEELKPMLERNGFKVIMTRNSLKDNVSNESVSASLSRRSEIANNAGADLFVSIHCNAGGGTGTETYYCTGNSDGKEFADHVQQGMLDAVGLRNRGVKSARFAVLRRTNMTAILVETAFIDTASDAKHLASESSRKAFAEGIARGICKYVGIEFK